MDLVRGAFVLPVLAESGRVGFVFICGGAGRTVGTAGFGLRALFFDVSCYGGADGAWAEPTGTVPVAGPGGDAAT